MSKNCWLDIKTLEGNLKSILVDQTSFEGKLLGIDRQPNVFSSAFPSEVVTCRFDDGLEIQLLLKYGISDKHTGHGFWGDTTYEAKVYRELLGMVPATKPKFYGTFKHKATGQTCIVLEFICDSLRLDKSSQKAMILSARWLGQFHAAIEKCILEAPAVFLNAYDEKYYLGWVKRTSLYAGKLHLRYGWLETLCDQFREAISALLKGPKTMIHGEYYPKNILVRGENIYPVDWQSAAIARGEIDLASLTEGWGNGDIVRRCELEYQRARWPIGPPADFESALKVARLYWPLRWLGDKPDWTIHKKRRRYFDQLRIEGERAGFF